MFWANNTGKKTVLSLRFTDLVQKLFKARDTIQHRNVPKKCLFNFFQMQVTNPVLILAFIPIFDYGVYPLLGKILKLLEEPLCLPNWP